MADFVPSFAVSQNLGFPSVIVLTDTSTGTDETISQRNVYLQKADGTFLVPEGTTTNYIVWSIVLNTISIDVLDKDYALNVMVDYVNIVNTPLVFDLTFDTTFN